jgi:hypothetical protein
MRRLLRPALVLALALQGGAAFADSRIQAQGDATCPMLFDSIEMSGPRLRFELRPPGAEPMVSIFDGDEDLVTSLMPGQRQFMRMEVDADAADYTGDVASSSVTYMDRQMAKARAMMEQQCGGNRCAGMPDLEAMMRMGTPGAPPPIETRAGAADTVGGIACAWREWVQAGAVVRRECLAPIVGLPLPERDRAGLVRGMRVMMQYGESFASFKDHFGLAQEPQPPNGQLVLSQVCLAGAGETGKATMTFVEAPVDPAKFEVPAGYTPALGAPAQP